MTQPAPESFNERLQQLIPSAHRLGVRVVELAPGMARSEVPLQENTNHLGTMYAAAMFTVAEVLGGALVLATFDVARYYPVVKELTLRFRRPARSDVSARAALPVDLVASLTAEADNAGKAEFILDVDLLDAAGQIVATSHGTYQIRRHGS